MKPLHFAAVMGGLLVVALVLLLAGRPAQAPDAAARTPAHLVTVIGEGEVRPKPDMVQISFGIMTHGASAIQAEALSLASVADVKAAVIAAGADESSLDVAPNGMTTTTFQDFAGAVQISGFQSKVTVSAVVRNVNRAQAVIEAGLNAGATSLERVAYTVEDAEAARQAAMREALANARTRAVALVRAQGEGLGELQGMEVLPEESAPDATSPTSLVFKARVKATFGF